MSDVMTWAAPSADDHSRLVADVDALVATWAHRLVNPDSGAATEAPRAESRPGPTAKREILGQMLALTMILESAEAAMSTTVARVLDVGATFAEIGQVVGISRQAAEQRFGHLLGQRHVAVVISRRDRVRVVPDDPRGQVGEVGPDAQYASDRGLWPIGRRVRAEARYAIVAVDGKVRRVYRLDPDGWRKVDGKWQFRAVGDRPLSLDEIQRAAAAGDLPLVLGDDCPTRAGGAYRPLRF